MNQCGDVVAYRERLAIGVPAIQSGDHIAPFDSTEEPLADGHQDIQPRTTTERRRPANGPG